MPDIHATIIRCRTKKPSVRHGITSGFPLEGGRR
jgi:hypothetical protein